MDAKTTARRADPRVGPALNRAGLPRLDAIDMLRGLVIAIMVLDHVRDFIHPDAFVFNPTDPARTTTMLYLTRWVTHLCAPTFVFLAGVSACLQRISGKDLPTLSRFLLTRGVWLVLLEVTVVGFGFNFGFPFLFLQVIWAIGAGMVILAALVWLPPRVVLGIGVAIVAGHGLLGSIKAADLGALAPLWHLAFEFGPLGPSGSFVAYPAVPWLGVMCLGYGLGHVFVRPVRERRRTLLALALGALAVFFVLRLLNRYGDPAPWAPQQDDLRTVLSFFNVTKYPPSLLFVLVTLGMSLVVMTWLERLRGFPARVLLAYGRTPLFTYVLHIYVVHCAALLIGVATGFPAAGFFHFLADPTRLMKLHWGYALPVVYAVWLSVLAILYLPARWFADVKRRRRDWWLGYA
jgi:uncharacterized membrane protein